MKLCRPKLRATDAARTQRIVDAFSGAYRSGTSPMHGILGDPGPRL